jgi:hypothetical protein
MREASGFAVGTRGGGKRRRDGNGGNMVGLNGSHEGPSKLPKVLSAAEPRDRVAPLGSHSTRAFDLRRA